MKPIDRVMATEKGKLKNPFDYKDRRSRRKATRSMGLSATAATAAAVAAACAAADERDVGLWRRR